MVKINQFAEVGRNSNHFPTLSYNFFLSRPQFKVREQAVPRLHQVEGCTGIFYADFVAIQLRHYADYVIEVLLMYFAHVRTEQGAVSGNNHGERQADEADARRLGDRHCVLFADQNRVIKLRFRCVGDDGFRKLNGNADDLEAIRAVLVLKRLQQRNLATTGCTPGCPEVEDAVFAIPFGKLTLVAIQTVELESNLRCHGRRFCNDCGFWCDWRQILWLLFEK